MLCLAGCDGHGAAPAPAPAPGGGASAAAPLEWDPADLDSFPGEIVAQPGSGNTWLTGTAVDEGGKPVPGTLVEMHAAPKGEGYPGPALHASVPANPDGTFRVGPGPSPWWSKGMLSAKAPGYARAALFSRGIANPGITASEEGVENRLVMVPGYTVHGEVRARDGGPPDGPVTLWATANKRYFEIARTDAGGAFTFDAPAAEVLVRALPGPHPIVQEVVDVGPGKENRILITVERGRDIRGTVLDQADGTPVPGAAVTGFYGEARTFVAGKDGKFLLPKYWAASFQVRAPGYATRVHQLADDSGRGMSEPEVVRLTPGCVARGKVLDDEGKPVKAARLRILTFDAAGDRLSPLGPASHADGSYVFVGLPVPLPGKGFRIFAKETSHAWGYSKPFVASHGQVVDGLDVGVVPLVLMEGRLVDEAGGPVEGYLEISWDLPPDLEPYRDFLGATARVLAGKEGFWQASVPARTPYKGFARGEAFAEKRFEGTTPPRPGGPGKGSDPVVVRVARGVSIRGVVVDADGKPVDHGEVRIEPHPPTDPRPSQDALLRPEGTFQAGGLAPGLYDLSILSRPGFLQEVVKEVQAGGPEVKVTLRRPGSIRVRVVVPPEAPAGTPVELTARGLEETRPLPAIQTFRVEPGEAGFRVGPLSPGPYALSFRCGDFRADVERVAVGQGNPTDLGEVALKPGASIAGRVLRSGAPLDKAMLEVLRILPDGRSESVRRTKTGPDGSFRAGGLVAGRHLLTVRAQDRPFLEVPFEIGPGEERTLDVAVTAGGRLRVRVVDGAGRPVAGARVVLSGPAGGVLYWKAGSPEPPPHGTGPEGVLDCAGLPAGELRVDAEKPGTGSGTATVKVAEGGEGTVEVRIGK